MRFLADIADFITDEDFLAGVATGVSETIDKGEARREKALDRLQTYGLEKSNRIEQEYLNDLDANEEQVKQLAAKLTPEGVSANSQDVLAAAQYLIQTRTLAGAQAEADRLYAQYKRFGISQLKEINTQAVNDGVNLSFRGLAGGITRRPAPVDLTSSGFEVAPTFLDRVFGGQTVEEEAQRSIDNLQSAIPDQEVLPIIASTGYDADLIIRPDMPVKDEIIRMKDLLKVAQSNNNTEKMDLIKDKIEVLETAEIRERIAGAKGFSTSERRVTTNYFISTISGHYNLEIKKDILSTDGVRTFAETSEATKEASKFARVAANDMSRIRQSGNADYNGELLKLEGAVFANRAYEVVEGEYGILSIRLLEEGNKLFKNLNFDGGADSDDGSILDNGSDDNTTTQDRGSAEDYLPEDSDATIADNQTTGINVTTEEITKAVDNFRNLPPNASGLDKNRARREVQEAILAANPNMPPTEAMAQARKLLGE